MENAELMRALLELASRCGLEVRAAGGEGAPASGMCRLRDRFWVVLSDRDPVAVQIDVLAGALAAVCGEELDRHFLPPAVRERLEASAPPGSDFGDGA